MLDHLGAVEHAEHRVGVADVNRQQHSPVRSARRPEPGPGRCRGRAPNGSAPRPQGSPRRSARHVRAVARVSPPLASSSARPAASRDRRRAVSATAKLSSRIRSAPAASASATCSSVSHSTSSGRPGACARTAAKRPRPTRPRRTWLSLISAASDSDIRWFTPAAAAHRVLLQRPQAGQWSCGCRGSWPRCRRPRRPTAG